MSDEQSSTPGGLAAAMRRRAQRSERHGGWPCEGGPMDGEILPNRQAPQDYPWRREATSPVFWSDDPTPTSPVSVVWGRYVFEEWKPYDCSRYVWVAGGTPEIPAATATGDTPHDVR